MRLGKDVLESDLYAELGLLPDATASEVRVAYRHRVRASHPDLNQHDPDAAARMTRLNIAAKVLLDPALRRAYDRAPRASSKSREVRPPRDGAWFERAEQSADNDWAPPPAAQREHPASFGNFFGQLRGRDGQVSLQLQELIESLTARQQIGVAALLFALALGLLVMAHPQGMVDDANQPTSVNVGSVYP